MDVKLYDRVMLKDKREGIIIEIYEPNKAYEIEFMMNNTGEYPEYETETIEQENIEKVIKEV